MHTYNPALSLLLATGCGAAPGIPATGTTMIIEGAGSFVSESSDEVAIVRSAAAAVRMHGAFGRFRLGPSLELNGWLTRDGGGANDPFAALQLGVDGSVLSVDGRVRSQISGGASILLDGSDVDRPGQAGFYLDLRPVIYRFLVGDELVLGLTPIGFAVLVPDPSGIPIVDVQYRGIVSLEFGP